MEPGRIHELTASAEGRIDAVLAGALPGVSRARVQRLLAESAVTLNGCIARKSDRVAIGDHLTVNQQSVEHPQPEEAPVLEVLYEDDAYVVVNKPPGVVVHGGPGESAPSVAAWFLKRYPREASQFDVERPGIVHRLDKDTSGVLLLARTPAAQTWAGQQFEDRSVEKLYLAVTDGVPGRKEALIDAPIGRHPADRMKMAVVRRGREARTGYQVLGGDARGALLLVKLFTGRTHQIRVHLAAIGTPVSRDSVYGTAGDGRQLLHAWRLTVPHPDGGTITATAPAPGDVVSAIRELGLESLALEYSQPAVPQRRLSEDP